MEEASPPLARAHGWAVAAVATLAMTVSYTDRQALAAIAPTVRQALGIDQTHYGWLTAGFSLSYLLGAPIAGLLLDRTGARKGLAGAVLAWSAVAALHALAPSFAVLFALRVALGVTEAPSFPGAAQAVRRVLRGRDRATAYGLLFTGSSVGAMIAGPIAIGLNTRGGFALAFVGVACAGVMWVPLWLVVTRGRARTVLATTDEGSHVSPDHRSPLALLRHPSVLRALVLVIGSAPVMLFVLAWFPQYLASVHRIPQGDLGRFIWSPPFFFDVGAVGFAALAARAPRARGPSAYVLVGALLASSIALLPLASRLAPAGHTGAWIATVVAGIAMLGGGAVYSLLTADMLSRVPTTRVSLAGGMTAAAQSLAHIVGAPLIGRALDRSHSYSSSCVAVGMLVLPAAGLWILWGASPRLEARRET